MSSLQKQCQVQLELDRTTTEAYLEQQAHIDEVRLTDSVARQQVLQQMHSKLYSIDRALKRLANNQFGACQMCGHPIDPERLMVLPHAELCIDCQRQAAFF